MKVDNRALLGWLGLAYLAFVIYGSLVPLQYQSLPLDEALGRFPHIMAQPGSGSRTDWATNLLLFIPLTFLFTGALGHGRSLAFRLLISLVLAVAAFFLTLGIEFTQLFFPPRSTDRNDVLAETLGGLLGIAAWWGLGGRWMAWLSSWRKDRPATETADKLAWAYLLLVFAYGVLPLDLTLSGVEIFHKWRAGKLHLIPFMALPHAPVELAYEMLSDVLLWAPLALLWRLSAGRSGFRAWRMTLAAAVVLEVLQLFVYSRVSDVTDILTAALGAALGVLLGSRLARHGPAPVRATPASRGRKGVNAYALILLPVWLAVLMAVFWYPFDFRTDAGFVQERIGFLWRMPLESYFYGSEFRAITEMLHKLLFFAPLGALLAWLVAGLPWLWRSYAAFAAILLMLATAVGIEFGQMLLPGKVADTTDMVLESLGGFFGYALFRFLRLRMRAVPQARPDKKSGYSPSVSARPVAVVPGLAKVRDKGSGKALGISWWVLGLGLAVGTFLFVLMPRVSGLPYNLRELIDPRYPWLSAALLSVFWFCFAGLPAALGQGLGHGSWLQKRFLPATLLHAMLAAVLVMLAVPDESVHDLVGSPILHWPWQLEPFARLSVLFALISVLLTAGSWLALALIAHRLLPGLRQLGITLVLLLALAYWVVVVQAATDNLTELMAREGRGHALVVLSGAGLLFAVAVSLFASSLARAGRGLGLALLWLVVTLPLGYALLQLGLAGHIDKYGHEFSALQFLLSRDRQSYAGSGELLLRFVVTWCGGVLATAIAQWAFAGKAKIFSGLHSMGFSRLPTGDQK